MIYTVTGIDSYFIEQLLINQSVLSRRLAESECTTACRFRTANATANRYPKLAIRLQTYWRQGELETGLTGVSDRIIFSAIV